MGYVWKNRRALPWFRLGLAITALGVVIMILTAVGVLR